MPLLGNINRRNNLEAVDEENRAKKRVVKDEFKKWAYYDDPAAIMQKPDPSDQKHALVVANELLKFDSDLNDNLENVREFLQRKTDKTLKYETINMIVGELGDLSVSYNKLANRIGIFKSKNLFSSSDSQSLKMNLNSYLPNIKELSQQFAYIGSPTASEILRRMYNNISGGYLASVPYNTKDIASQLIKANTKDLEVAPKEKEEYANKVDSILNEIEEEHGKSSPEAYNIILDVVNQLENRIRTEKAAGNVSKAREHQSHLNEMLRRPVVNAALKSSGVKPDEIKRQITEDMPEFKEAPQNFTPNPALQASLQGNGRSGGRKHLLGEKGTGRMIRKPLFESYILPDELKH